MKLGSLIEDHMTKRGLTLRQLAREIQCDHTTLHRLIQGEPCRMDTLTKVMIWLCKPAKV